MTRDEDEDEDEESGQTRLDGGMDGWSEWYGMVGWLDLSLFGVRGREREREVDLSVSLKVSFSGSPSNNHLIYSVQTI